jgi:quercetin dioxygenase-like cupin family protein
MKYKHFVIGSLSGAFALASAGVLANCAPNDPGACTDMLLQSSVTWDGAPIKYLRTKNPELTVRTIQFAPGVHNKMHIHEAPVYIYVMTGSFEVFLADGRYQRWEAGEAFNEVMNTAHNGGNPGTVWTKLVIMSPSIKGCPFMTPTPLANGPQCREDEDSRDGRGWGHDEHGGWSWGGHPIGGAGNSAK